MPVRMRVKRPVEIKSFPIEFQEDGCMWKWPEGGRTSKALGDYRVLLCLSKPGGKRRKCFLIFVV